MDAPEPTPEERAEIIERAGRRVCEIMRTRRGAVHGWTASGMCDIEFPTMWAAVDWATEYNVRSLVEPRDPVGEMFHSVVMVLDLYDFAMDRAADGRAL